jgi:hypothetical protein
MRDSDQVRKLVGADVQVGEGQVANRLPHLGLKLGIGLRSNVGDDERSKDAIAKLVFSGCRPIPAQEAHDRAYNAF